MPEDIGTLWDRVPGRVTKPSLRLKGREDTVDVVRPLDFKVARIGCPPRGPHYLHDVLLWPLPFTSWEECTRERVESIPKASPFGKTRFYILGKALAQTCPPHSLIPSAQPGTIHPSILTFLVAPDRALEINPVH